MVARAFPLLILVLAVGLGACGFTEEKQWYKPNQNYTVAEFQRDQATCTKSKMLDEACMKERGWVPLSADRGAPVKAPEPGRGPRY
ncbi:MAG TPA: hypothetical protein VFN71_00575 [Methylomirabilota bacterium]|nr:hypothetical protein [Methylomirabilota bacterium]